MDKKVLIVIAILVLLLLWKRKDIVGSITGIIDTPPAILAKADGVSVEVESLARAMQSEESTDKARIAIGWAVKNYAKRQGKSITDVVTKSSNPNANGKYSRQDFGKYCSTLKAPSSRTLQLASDIISGRIPDPTGGAIQWDAPKAQLKLHKQNPSKWKSPDDVAKARIAAGRKPIVLADVPNTRFWA